ncbi:helix-turn-helix transcriptional regulator [Dactylosporangium sp. NPDC051485]|uniref:AraC family transcriptional regulator n=1 Tax=Dactylosporangium sp. NPDC051485 TaxID=3154846 RepID=UPI003425A4F4
MPEFRHLSQDLELIFPLGHDQRTPVHTHPLGHLVYPATGLLSLVTETGAWIAPPNRVVWIPAGFEHQHRAHGSTDMHIVFLSAAMAAQLPDAPAVLVMTPLAREATLALTRDEARSASSLTRLRWVIIDDVVSAPEQPLHLPEPRDDRLLAIAALVERDLSSPVTLDQLGREVGASERTLSRLFYRETGMGFRQWRTQLRIHRALIMLTEGTPVTGVAAACGWANPSAFIDAFTALVGQSPGRYQRSLL